MKIKKWEIYLITLVAGYATGIGTLGLFPQMWLKYGMSGLILHLVFLAMFTYLAIMETKKIGESDYFFAEFYEKVVRKPGIILLIFSVIVLFLSYYTANVGLSVLAPYLGTETLGRLISKIVVLAIIVVILARAREKTFTIMAIGSMAFIFLTLLLAVSSYQISRIAEITSLGK
ncbi:hypothetical protein PFDSM3638_08750 [Pyrococcus furiosus DSM 3638]|uniref:Transporter n=2 Tax=Pyrococcus furiosus (strain ATCC 43587 / DSM 3638 / JCM 8422 / Vc1) TaxID=186497 RepID=A0A5C0XQK1_PYRFU|nr:hypothetical protein PF1727 [Pyrococcus furiosus DSM 3638]QEK79343.1 hypothetical protein PFDSM3638_08750 [Pyrococcus furiosus DSM 3638]